VSRAELLYGLQAIDLELEGVANMLGQVEVQLNGDQELSRAKTQLENERSELLLLEKQQKSMEWEADDLRAKNIPLSNKLYSGATKNPKELIALQQEVEYFKKQIETKEDKALALMGEMDNVQEQVGQRSQEVEQLEKKWQARRQELLTQKSDLEVSSAEGKRKRQTLAETLSATELDLYEVLRTRNRRPAVAKVEQGMCQGCRIGLPLNKLQQVRMQQEAVQCSNCERILYLE